MADTNINKPNTKNLADAAIKCWHAIKTKDIQQFGTAFRESFEAQIAMFPNMVNPNILDFFTLTGHADAVRF